MDHRCVKWERHSLLAQFWKGHKFCKHNLILQHNYFCKRFAWKRFPLFQKERKKERKRITGNYIVHLLHVRKRPNRFSMGLWFGSQMHFLPFHKVHMIRFYIWKPQACYFMKAPLLGAKSVQKVEKHSSSYSEPNFFHCFSFHSTLRRLQIILQRL